MTHTCHTCPAPAAWRDQQGRCWCSSHLPTNGQYRSLPRPAEPDIVERLETHPQSTFGMLPVSREMLNEAAAEIRRLRAELVGKHKRHGREEG